MQHGERQTLLLPLLLLDDVRTIATTGLANRQQYDVNIYDFVNLDTLCLFSYELGRIELYGLSRYFGPVVDWRDLECVWPHRFRF